MAVAHDATGHSTGNSVSTTSFTHTPVGTPSAVLIGYYSRKSASVVGDVPSSAPTYGGTAATLITSATDATSLLRLGCYYLAAPATGAQTVSMSWAASQLGLGLFAVTVTGDSGSSPGAVKFASAAGNSTSTSVTPVAPGTNDLVIFWAASNTASAGYTTGSGMSTGQVQMFIDNSGNNDWVVDRRPGSSGSAAMTHAVTTGTWFGATIDILAPVAAASLVVGPRRSYKHRVEHRW